MSGPPASTVRADGSAAALAWVLSLSVPGANGDRPYDVLKRGLKDAIARDPFDATVVTVLGGAFLFYLAEKGHNPKVVTYWDALVFVSTCLSVGYADVFARTSAGKALASALMTVGPALSGALLDPQAGATGDAHPREHSDTERLAVQHVIVEKLDAILGELRRSR